MPKSLIEGLQTGNRHARQGHTSWVHSHRSNAKINYDGILFMLDKFCGAAWLGLRVHIFGSGLGYQFVRVFKLHVLGCVIRAHRRTTCCVMCSSAHGEIERERESSSEFLGAPHSKQLGVACFRSSSECLGVAGSARNPSQGLRSSSEFLGRERERDRSRVLLPLWKVQE